MDLESKGTVEDQIDVLIYSFVGWRSIIVRFTQKMDRKEVQRDNLYLCVLAAIVEE